MVVSPSIAAVAAAAEVAAANQLLAAEVRRASSVTVLPSSESVGGEMQLSTRSALLASSREVTSGTVTSLAVSPLRVEAPPAVPTVMKTRSAAAAAATLLKPHLAVSSSIAAAEVAAANQLLATEVRRASNVTVLPSSESVGGEMQLSTRSALLASSTEVTSGTVTSLAVSPLRVEAPPTVPTVMKTRSAVLAEAIAAAAAAAPPRPRPPKVFQPSSSTAPTTFANLALTGTAILPPTFPSPPSRSLPPLSVSVTPSVILPKASLVPETFGSSPSLPSTAAILPKIDKIYDSKPGAPITTTRAAIIVPIGDPAAVPIPVSPILGSTAFTSDLSTGGENVIPDPSTIAPVLHVESKIKPLIASRIKDIENHSMSPTITAPVKRTISSVIPGKLIHGKEQVKSISADKVPRTGEGSNVEETNSIEKINLPVDGLKSNAMNTMVPLREENVMFTECEANYILSAESLENIRSVESDEKPNVPPPERTNAAQLIKAASVVELVGNDIAVQRRQEINVEGLRRQELPPVIQSTRDDDTEATKESLSKKVNPAVLSVSIKAVPPGRVSAIITSKNTVLKAHLVSRLRSVLDAAEDFTNMGMHVADLAKSIANEECVGDAPGNGDNDSDSVYEQVFQICRALATHRQLAAFEFLPQLLAVLPTYFLRSVAARTELFIFVNVLPPPSSSSSSGPKAASTTVSVADAEEEEQRAKWAMAALRLLAFHTNDDPLTYAPCMPVLYSLMNTYRTIMLLSHLYRGVRGSDINAVMSILKVAEDHLTSLKTAVITCDGVASNRCIREASAAIESTTALSLSSPCLSLWSISSTAEENQNHSGSLAEGVGGVTFSPHQSVVAAAMSVVTVALKQLQEDLAVLRRVNRIPDSNGINSKMLLKLDSGKLWCHYYSLYQPFNLLWNTQDNNVCSLCHYSYQNHINEDLIFVDCFKHICT